MTATSHATACTAAIGQPSRDAAKRSNGAQQETSPERLIVQATVDVEPELAARTHQPGQRTHTRQRIFEMVDDSEAVDEIEALGSKRREPKVGLDEVSTVSVSRSRNINRGAHVHPDDLGTLLPREMQPAAHAAAGIKHTQALPSHRLGTLEIPVEDSPVDVVDLGEPLPLVAERTERTNRVIRHG